MEYHTCPERIELDGHFLGLGEMREEMIFKFAADGIYNLSGFGFNGFDDKGEAKWDLATNVYAYKFEVYFSFIYLEFLNEFACRWLSPSRSLWMHGMWEQWDG